MTLGWRKRDGGDIGIFNVETRSLLGYVERRGKSYQVQDGDNHFVAVVGSMDEAGRVLAAYCEKHARWELDGDNRYGKWTEYGLLQVERGEEPVCWFVSRNGEQTLMRDGEAANFPTQEQAQRAADARRSDAPTGSRGTSDGLSWFTYRKLTVDGILN